MDEGVRRQCKLCGVAAVLLLLFSSTCTCKLAVASNTTLLAAAIAQPYGCVVSANHPHWPMYIGIGVMDEGDLSAEEIAALTLPCGFVVTAPDLSKSKVMPI